MSLTTEDFLFIRTLVLDRSAIVLEAGKEYLVESRLLPLARKEGLDSIEALVKQVKGPGSKALQTRVVEAMTTNETSFFRDIHPFDALRRHILPELIERRAAQRTLSIWSAASSSGQEVYSIAMLIREHFPQLAGWKIELVATDLSKEMIQRASTGCYSQLEVNRGLPATMLVKYFVKDGLTWQLKPEIRSMVSFREINLVEQWPPLPDFDIVFIRNVLIYFSVETKRDILGKIRQVLRRDGYLFLGAAETTLNIDDQYLRAQYDKAWCYRLQG